MTRKHYNRINPPRQKEEYSKIEEPTPVDDDREKMDEDPFLKCPAKVTHFSWKDQHVFADHIFTHSDFQYMMESSPYRLPTLYSTPSS
jgi:hypothetical protein